MTIMIVLSDCPPKLRGDMTKWFVEINTGVYVGNLNARVRDEVWDRITANIGRGHATMVFSASGEQHLDFRVHNAYWEPVDFDGIKLMRRPESAGSSESPPLKSGFSSVSQRRRVGGKSRMTDPAAGLRAVDYVVLDLETTGLDEKNDRIIEAAAIRVRRGKITGRMESLIRSDIPIPPEIVRLTGITEEELEKNGREAEEALDELAEFVGDLPLVCHNAAFEKGFLASAYLRLKEDPPENRFIDTLKLAQMLLPDLENHKLETLARYFGLEGSVSHRAMADCETTYGIYGKLNELASSDERKNEKKLENGRK